MYFEWDNRHKASTEIYLCDVAKEVATISKNLLDSYRKKVKSVSSGEPIDECVSQWGHLGSQLMNVYLNGDTLNA